VLVQHNQYLVSASSTQPISGMTTYPSGMPSSGSSASSTQPISGMTTYPASSSNTYSTSTNYFSTTFKPLPCRVDGFSTFVSNFLIFFLNQLI